MMQQFHPPFFAGIDLGDTSIKCGVVDDTGHPLLKRAVDVDTEAAKGVEVSLRNMADGVRQAIEQAGLTFDDIAAVGLGSPGTMDIPAGMLLEPVNLRGPGWQNYPIRDRLAEIGRASCRERGKT